jgi:hypothetical protein
MLRCVKQICVPFLLLKKLLGKEFLSLFPITIPNAGRVTFAQWLILMFMVKKKEEEEEEEENIVPLTRDSQTGS